MRLAASDYFGPLFEQGPRIDTGTLCDPEEKSVAGILNERVGAKMAMQVRDVAKACGIGDRKVQAIVQHLIQEHGAPIATGAKGWFLAETPEEMDRTLAIHNARAKSELKTMSRLKKTGIRAILAQIQTELLKEECA